MLKITMTTVLTDCQKVSECFTYINSSEPHNNSVMQYNYYLCFREEETKAQKLGTCSKKYSELTVGTGI